jgi:hypothetical protein
VTKDGFSTVVKIPARIVRNRIDRDMETYMHCRILPVVTQPLWNNYLLSDIGRDLVMNSGGYWWKGFMLF